MICGICFQTAKLTLAAERAVWKYHGTHHSAQWRTHSHFWSSLGLVLLTDNNKRKRGLHKPPPLYYGSRTQERGWEKPKAVDTREKVKKVPTSNWLHAICRTCVIKAESSLEISGYKLLFAVLILAITVSEMKNSLQWAMTLTKKQKINFHFWAVHDQYVTNWT